jgi:NAD(P)H-hydrate epimerase
VLLSRAEARELDRRAIEEFGIPSLVLMENAGRGITELLVSLGVQGRVVIFCGKGNNGGDGFVIARHLDGRGLPVRVLFFGRPEDLPGDASANYHILLKSGISLKTWDGNVDEAALTGELAAGAWVVDALFGTGLRGPVKTPFDRIIAAVNSCSARVLAVDIPSGLDSDTGQPLGPTIRAHHTATLVARKKGFNEPAAQAWLGQVQVMDLGLPRKLLSLAATRKVSAFAIAPLPPRG